MGLFDFLSNDKKETPEAKAAMDPAAVAKAEINGAYNFLREAGVKTDGLNIDFERNSFVLKGTVEEGEELTKLSEVVATSGSDKQIINNVELKDWSAENVLMKVKTRGSNLNVRAGTNSSFEIVGKFANGQDVTLVNKTQKDWYKMRSGGIEGYCHTDYLV